MKPIQEGETESYTFNVGDLRKVSGADAGGAAEGGFNPDKIIEFLNNPAVQQITIPLVNLINSKVQESIEKKNKKQDEDSGVVLFAD